MLRKFFTEASLQKSRIYHTGKSSFAVGGIKNICQINIWQIFFSRLSKNTHSQKARMGVLA